jgi:hypothetical protein
VVLVLPVWAIAMPPAARIASALTVASFLNIDYTPMTCFGVK